ncbi:MAG: SDR family NAD(P)-dependent oxidoreductase [Spongiibacteraceae bacterium]
MSSNYFNLDNKLALVTGASSGLGAHFSKVLASEGAHVILAARRKDKLDGVVNEILESGGRADAVAMDITNPDSVSRAYADIQGQHGAIDILINNAGVANAATKFLDMTETEWGRVIDTNLTGAWRVAQAGAKQMVAAGKPGSIVNIGSIYGLHTGVLKAEYNASKAAIVQLSKSMAMELSRIKIRVNTLCPGWFLTDMNDEYFASESAARYISGFPTARLGQLDELTVPLLLLASDHAGAYINASCITVDGGLVESPI